MKMMHSPQTTLVVPAALMEQVDSLRLALAPRLDATKRSELGQYFTPAAVARLMASLFAIKERTLRLLDAGAGIGSLSTAVIAELCNRQERPSEIELTAYEIDATLIPHLKNALASCEAACLRAGIRFRYTIRQQDFIESAVLMLEGGFFAARREVFDCAILNPPYHKLHSRSRARLSLRRIGIETSNLYTAFMTLVTRLLDDGGQLVSITPRSFCNGPYFRPFREEFLREMRLCQLHVFESRRSAFRDDAVLQENVIIHAVKGTGERGPVVISASAGTEDGAISVREVPYAQVVEPADPERFIRIAADASTQEGVGALLARCPATLADVGVMVSTGRVVDFRAKEYLRDEPGEDTAPLIYPTHLAEGRVTWPKQTRKPNALALSPVTRGLVVPSGSYVLVKRFTAKEERRRVVAVVCDPADVPGELFGFENHLNYFHAGGNGLAPSLARGLAAFLNSSLLDAHFRQFNGHTQVNATDLRSLRYPSRPALERLGTRLGTSRPDQATLDAIIMEELLR